MALKENQRCLADHLGFSAAFAPLQGIPQLPCKVVGAERFLGSQWWGAILGCDDCFLVLGFCEDLSWSKFIKILQTCPVGLWQIETHPMHLDFRSEIPRWPTVLFKIFNATVKWPQGKKVCTVVGVRRTMELQIPLGVEGPHKDPCVNYSWSSRIFTCFG